jgi:hypothetical protein
MTNTDQRQREWEKRLAVYKASGLKPAAWCATHHVTLEQLRYWMRNIRETALHAKRSLPPYFSDRAPFRFCGFGIWRQGESNPCPNWNTLFKN